MVLLFYYLFNSKLFKLKTKRKFTTSNLSTKSICYLLKFFKMKNIILLAVIMLFTLVSCNQKNKEVETTNAPVTEQDTTTVKDGTEVVKDSKVTDKVYACPMHSEAKGKLNDKCPKCGMKLTVEVK